MCRDLKPELETGQEQQTTKGVHTHTHTHIHDQFFLLKGNQYCN
jgi:hypothetical protein